MAKKSEQGFSATVENFQGIMSKLSKREFAPLYLLYGEEPYFIDQISDYITANAIAEEEWDFNREIIYGQEQSAASVMELSRTYPMMADHRVVVVREAGSLSDFNKLEQYFENPVPTTILVICYKGKNIDKRLTVYKKAVAKGVVFESVPARDYEIKSYLSQLVERRGCSIDAKAKELLVEHLGCDLVKIDNEIVKLLNAMAEGENKITCDHIERFIGISKEYNIFELTTALGTKDVNKSLSIAAYFESNPKNNPLVMTLPSIFKYFLTVFCVGMIIFDHKKRGKPMPDNFTMAKMAKLPGAFFVDKYITASRYYPPAKSLEILGIIRKYDLRSKGMGGGSLPDGELLRELLLKIFMI